MSIISGTAHSSGDSGFYDFPIEQSLRFDGSSYFSRSPASPDSLRWTISLWLKRSALGSTQDIFSGYDGTGNDDTTGGYTFLRFESNDKINFSARNQSIFTTTAVYRDTSAFYHIVLVFNSSSSSALLYVNSVLQTTTSPSTSYIDSANSWNSGATSDITNQIGSWNSSNKLKGYIAEFNNIDGYKTGTTVATHDDFGETKSGVWIPKAYTGSYGTNGFHLDFRDATSTTTLGYDYSGNNNHWTLN